jgi:carbonic anhydrase
MSTETPPNESPLPAKVESPRNQLLKTIGLISLAAVGCSVMTLFFMNHVEKAALAKGKPAQNNVQDHQTAQPGHEKPPVASHAPKNASAPEHATGDHGGATGQHKPALKEASDPHNAQHQPTHAQKQPAEGGSVTFAKLIEGNKRYVASGATHPHQTNDRRTEVAKEQKPFAIILACADSRVSPEIIFDQGLGDLFVVRVAGNIVDDHALGSLEYAAEHFNVGLIVVLGHERCGAVTAALAGGHAPGHIASIVEAIKPAVAKISGKGDEALDAAIAENIKFVVQQLRSSAPILKEKVAHHKLEVVGARYDLDTGAVTSVAP